MSFQWPVNHDPMSSVKSSLFASLIGAVASLTGLVVPVSAHAETISNTATITWDAGAKRVGLSSNPRVRTVEALTKLGIVDLVRRA